MDADAGHVSLVQLPLTLARTTNLAASILLGEGEVRSRSDDLGRSVTVDAGSHQGWQPGGDVYAGRRDMEADLEASPSNKVLPTA